MEKKNALSLYLQSLYKYPKLDKEEEIALAKKIQAGDKRALDKLVKHNLRLVVYLAKRQSAWEHSKMPIADIVAIGNEHLLEAAMKWKPNGTASFGAFAQKFIRWGIRRQVNRTENIISLPEHIIEKIKRLQYQERVLTQKLGKPPTDGELAKELGVDLKHVQKLQTILNREPISLEALAGSAQKEEDLNEGY